MFPFISRLGRWATGLVPQWIIQRVVGLVVERLLGGKQEIACSLETISSLITDCQLQRIDLLKVDVERAELDVLQGVESQHWPLIRQVAMEAHENDLEAIKSLLYSVGMSVTIVQDPHLKNSKLFNLYAIRE